MYTAYDMVHMNNRQYTVHAQLNLFDMRFYHSLSIYASGASPECALWKLFSEKQQSSYFSLTANNQLRMLHDSATLPVLNKHREQETSYDIHDAISWYTVYDGMLASPAYISVEKSDVQGKMNEIIAIRFLKPRRFDKLSIIAQPNAILSGYIYLYVSDEDYMRGIFHSKKYIDNVLQYTHLDFTFSSDISYEIIELQILQVCNPEQHLQLSLIRPFYCIDFDDTHIVQFQISSSLKSSFGTINGITLDVFELSIVDSAGLYDVHNPQFRYGFEPGHSCGLYVEVVYETDSGSTMTLPLGQTYTAPLLVKNGQLYITAKRALALSLDKSIATVAVDKDSLYNVLLLLLAPFVGDDVARIDYMLLCDVIQWRLFGNASLGATLKELCTQYQLYIYEDVYGFVIIQKAYTMQKMAQLYLNSNNLLRCEMHYDNKNIINALRIMYRKYTLSGDDLATIYSYGLFPEDIMHIDTVSKQVIDSAGVEKQIQYTKCDCAQLSLVAYARLYPHTIIRTGLHKNNSPSLTYCVLAPYAMDSNSDSYIKSIVISKDGNTSIKKGYIEWTYSIENIYVDSVHRALITISFWFYESACYQNVIYQYDDAMNIVYDAKGYAVVTKQIPYETDDVNVLHGELFLMPAPDKRRVLLVNKKIQLPASYNSKRITEHMKKTAEIIHIDGGQNSIIDNWKTTYVPISSYQQILWVSIKQVNNGLDIYYINNTGTDISFEVMIYGRLYIEHDVNEIVHEDNNSIRLYGRHEQQLINNSFLREHEFLRTSAYPLHIAHITYRGNPHTRIGDSIAIQDKYGVWYQGIVIRRSLSITTGMTEDVELIVEPIEYTDGIGELVIGK